MQWLYKMKDILYVVRTPFCPSYLTPCLSAREKRLYILHRAFPYQAIERGLCNVIGEVGI